MVVVEYVIFMLKETQGKLRVEGKHRENKGNFICIRVCQHCAEFFVLLNCHFVVSLGLTMHHSSLRPYQNQNESLLELKITSVQVEKC